MVFPGEKTLLAGALIRARLVGLVQRVREREGDGGERVS